MRVLLITGAYPPDECGVGDYTFRLAQALSSSRGREVAVLTTGNLRSKSAWDVFPIMQRWRLSEVPGFIGKVLSCRPDIVHFQYPSEAFRGSRVPSILPALCRLLPTKVVVTWHEPYHGRSRLHPVLHCLGAHGVVTLFPESRLDLPRLVRPMCNRRPRMWIPNASNLPVSQLTSAEKLHLRTCLLGGRQRLVVFFGFVSPSKGVEDVFHIADRETDALVIMGGVHDEAYAQHLKRSAKAAGWNEVVTFTGFVSPEHAADVLAVADAVLLPFPGGSHNANSSIHAALAQGTLVITTAVPARGDEPDSNLYTAAPQDISGMREALARLGGRRAPASSVDGIWEKIAQTHIRFYEDCSK